MLTLEARQDRAALRCMPQCGPVLARVKGTLAARGGAAALDPSCERGERSQLNRSEGRGWLGEARRGRSNHDDVCHGEEIFLQNLRDVTAIPWAR